MSVKILFSGDYVNSTNNSRWIGSEFKKVISETDVAFVNFEAPVTNDEMIPINKVGPHVKQASEAILHLHHAGFNAVSLANNHIYDYGQAGLQNTISLLQQSDFLFVGAGLTYENAYKPLIYKKGNIKVGILSACENEFGCLFEPVNKGGYAWLFSSKLEDCIVKLKSEVNHLILMAHAGVEDISLPIIEWRQRYKRLCDLGVDIVIGHHPHVPQGMEEYGHKLIFYSLGNIYFDTKPFYSKSDDSFSVFLELDKDSVNYKILTHKKDNLQVELRDNVSFDINYLNNLLTMNYQNNIDDICVKVFKQYYYSYYKSAMGINFDTSSVANMSKSIIKYFTKHTSHRKQKNNLMLLHNIRIDTHRFVVQRALSLLYEES